MDIAKFKSLLLKQKTEGMNLNKQDNDIVVEVTADDIDNASIFVNKSMDGKIKSRNILYLKKIDEALLRIENGVFGDCISCGDQIAEKRLYARPTAELCIACKEEQELNESGYNSL